MLKLDIILILVTKDLTGFELPSLPLPKAEPQSDNSEETSKPDWTELFISLFDYVKKPLESLKQMGFNEKNVNLKKKLVIKCIKNFIFIYRGQLTRTNNYSTIFYILYIC